MHVDETVCKPRKEGSKTGDREGELKGIGQCRIEESQLAC